MRSNRDTARMVVMWEVEKALDDYDLMTIERLMARLGQMRIETVIMDAVSKAIDRADDAGLALAERFANNQAEIREIREHRKGVGA
ncbi:MAG: hypothetical protein IJS96_08925 [Schwartzia sp.]|nr:hypothetical protein [Schwartzia sp. (in: firmicutes)]